MLATQMQTVRNGQNQILGWTMDHADGAVAAYIPGDQCSPLYLGHFQHRPDAHSAILDWNEADERRRQVRDSLITQEAARLRRRIETGERTIARLMKQLPAVTDHVDKQLIEIELIRLNEEVKLLEMLFATLSERPAGPGMHPGSPLTR
jgi:hypothetical protein